MVAVVVVVIAIGASASRRAPWGLCFDMRRHRERAEHDRRKPISRRGPQFKLGRSRAAVLVRNDDEFAAVQSRELIEKKERAKVSNPPARPPERRHFPLNLAAAAQDRVRQLGLAGRRRGGPRAAQADEMSSGPDLGFCFEPRPAGPLPPRVAPPAHDATG
jgi:hypothetical protein